MWERQSSRPTLSKGPTGPKTAALYQQVQRFLDLKSDYLAILILANVCSYLTNTIRVLANHILQKFGAASNDNDLLSLSGKSLRKRMSDPGAPISNQEMFFDHLSDNPLDCVCMAIDNNRSIGIIT